MLRIVTAIALIVSNPLLSLAAHRNQNDFAKIQGKCTTYFLNTGKTSEFEVLPLDKPDDFSVTARGADSVSGVGIIARTSGVYPLITGFFKGNVLVDVPVPYEMKALNKTIHFGFAAVPKEIWTSCQMEYL